MQYPLLLPLVLYLLLLFVVLGYACHKGKSSSLNEYYLGQRSVGGFVLTMTLTASYMSAGSFIGGPGAAYQYGLGWVGIALIQLPVMWLTLGVLGKKFAILARRYQALTLNDMLYARYGSRLLVWIASACLLLAFFAAMTVQFMGAARLLQSTLGLSYLQGLLIFGSTVSLYTLFGGFRAVVFTDTLQGLIMMVGTVLLLTTVIKATGGLEQAVITLRQIDAGLVTPHGPGRIINLPLMVSFWVLVCFGVIGLPHTAVRCMAYKNSRAMHQAMVAGSVVLGSVMLGMHLTGALGRAILPDLAIPDQIIPTLMIRILPPWAAGIFLAAPIAAMMSTVDSQLIQCSSTLTKDLYLSFSPQAAAHPQRLMYLSRATTLLLSLLLLVAAWRPPEMLIWLNLLAFGGLQVVFLWPLLLGLYWQRATACGALASMAVGSISYLIFYLMGIKWLGLHAVVPALCLGLIAFLLGNLVGLRWRA